MEDNKLKGLVENYKVVIIDFYATWCGPCQMYIPVFDEVSKLLSSDEIKFMKVDIDKFPELVSQHQVTSVPTTVIYVNGEVVEKLSGFNSKEQLIAQIRKVM